MKTSAAVHELCGRAALTTESQVSSKDPQSYQTDTWYIYFKAVFFFFCFIHDYFVLLGFKTTFNF